MLRLRPYRKEDAQTILSWSTDETTFYRWSAGMLGAYPPSVESLSFVETLMPFLAFDEEGPVGFFTLRDFGESGDEVRIGFIIVNPNRRGKGLGKATVDLGLRFAFDLYGAKRVSLGVFEDNLSAYHCYKAAGFRESEGIAAETVLIEDTPWVCVYLAITLDEYTGRILGRS